MSDEETNVNGEQFDDPNREAVGQPPAWTGAEGEEPEVDPEPETTTKKSRKVETETEKETTESDED